MELLWLFALLSTKVCLSFAENQYKFCLGGQVKQKTILIIQKTGIT